MGETFLWALVLVLTGAVVFLAGHIALRREKRQDVPPVRDTQDDLANMMILFQTMRDIIQQQKDLARQFNESLDKKVGVIRQAASAAMENLDKLREVERAVRAQIEEARADLESVQKQARYLREASPAVERVVVEVPAEPVPSPVDRVAELEAIEPLLQVVARPEEVADEGDLIDSWVGFDFHDEELPPAEPPEPEEEMPVTEVAEEEDGREAFRALLDLERFETVKGHNGAHGTNGSNGNGNGNGHAAVSPALQARVYQYHDAGMNVTQIAQELGIGKGEVRLMLNLRPAKDR